MSLLAPVLLVKHLTMDEQSSNRIHKILPRYCEGNVSQEEQKLVEEWIAFSDDNYRVVKQIHLINLAIETHNVKKRIDIKKALTNVSTKMSSSKRAVSYLGWIQRVAAVLLIPVLITLIVQNIDKHQEITSLIEVKTNPGMTTTINLPDGTVVNLNSESSLSYPATFKGDIRGVELKGEAWFSVAKDAKRRFIVSTPHQTKVEVLGTDFNVEAFEQDTTISTTLLKGKVNFLFRKGNQTEVIKMKPGEKLIYNTKDLRAQLFATTGESETAWKDGKIVFLDTPFKQALRMLEKRYNVEFVVSSPRYKQDAFTGVFSSQRLDRILEVFKISSKIRWRYLEAEDASDKKSRIEIY